MPVRISTILAILFMDSRGLNLEELLLSLYGGNEYLKENYRILDNLNVFPVPDGDTGTNMLATYQAGIKSVQSALASGEVKILEDICSIMDNELFNESRGNSGFIISRFFHGFFNVVKDDNLIESTRIAEGFRNGLFIVKTALLNPLEGTIVTIISAMTDIISECVKKNPYIDITELLNSAVKEARKVLFKTPEMLPVLAKAGVVDSGALGFIFIIQGMVSGLSKETTNFENESNYRFPPKSRISLDDNVIHNYRYCTELILEKSTNKPLEGIAEFLTARGDSIAIVDDITFKLHIHTDNPEEIIKHLLKFGKIGKRKIDDMHEQVSLVSHVDEDNLTSSILSFIPGSGFKEIFAAFGVTNYILYMAQLPSTGEILEKLESIDDKNIIILPNNNNILPVVLMVKEKSDKNISIIPTKNIIQGIVSLYGYSENENILHNVSSMKDCIDMAVALFVYRSVSDTNFDGIKIEKENFFVLHNKTITAVGKDFDEVVITAIASFNPENLGNISFYYGESFDRFLLVNIEKELKKINEFLEFESLYGGQIREEVIISLE
jgi:uncharacterized protein